MGECYKAILTNPFIRHYDNYVSNKFCQKQELRRFLIPKFLRLHNYVYFLSLVHQQFREAVKDCKLPDSDDTYLLRWLIGMIHNIFLPFK